MDFGEIELNWGREDSGGPADYDHEELAVNDDEEEKDF